ncbi:MAG: exodeoxyribonuclease VII small subunit [Gammaproteobacteria bacterium]|nr:exodeoxyribonuclease VII small subunit [Gammaproteobacteria bacterium]
MVALICSGAQATVTRSVYRLPGSAVSAPRKTPNFEKSLSELETLVERMEEGDMSLEDSLKAFENGIRLTQHCQQALTRAQQRVQILMQGEDEPREFDETEDQPDATEPNC